VREIDELKAKHDALMRRREELQQRKATLQGKRESALKALSELEEELRSKGIDPADVDNVLAKLVAKYKTQLEELSQVYDTVSSQLSIMEA
jgi:chromosome segregation ATPase